jgi:RNA polymerase sigma factor (TIGR02999 family)
MLLMPRLDSVAQLMGRFRQGDRHAAGQLVELFYPQLKQIAATKMRRESAPHTWQPTVLINELYLELVKIRALKAADSDEESEKTAFLKLSAHLMRRLLIHHARPLAKRVEREEFEEGLLNCLDGGESLHQIDNALDRLAAMDPNLRTVVELRVFEGLTGDEAAERMACSPRSVARYWNFARNWLAQEFGTT